MTADDRNSLSIEVRRGLYETIFRRRDMREFRPDPVPDEVLARMLVAAHRAGSVGFTQPWSFIVVRERERRAEIKAIFEDERARNAAQFTGARRELFQSLKLEGILEAPLNLIVTCETGRFGDAVLGKTSIPEVEILSTCLAVQNLWLAARAEGVGVGWVSILRNDAVRRVFSIPEHIVPVAYLCCGYVDSFPDRPRLQRDGWADPLAMRGLLHFDSWNSRVADEGQLGELVESASIWRKLFPVE